MQAVVLLALGTPSEPTVPAVRRFLRAFLGDKRVITLPWLIRKILLEAIILPFRAKRSAKMYQKVWTPQGSPFSVNTEALRLRMQGMMGRDVPVFIAMRYGEPSVKTLAQKLVARGVNEIAVLPQFPQYAESSWETAVEHFSAEMKKMAPMIELKMLPPFYDARGYIRAVAETLDGIDRSRDFIFSFHGIPVKSLLRVARGRPMNCDPASEKFEASACETCSAAENCYRRQCYATANSIAEESGIAKSQVTVAFQSRFGREQWLLPATAECPIGKNTVVIAPGFTADNLETLLELRELDAGTLVPCINDSPAYAEFLVAEAFRLLGRPFMIHN